MEIWIFNHHAQSPKIPGGTRHYDLSKQLIKLGHNVTIFAAGFHYTLLKEVVDYKGENYKVEYLDKVKFIWIKTLPYQVNNWKRMQNILSYSWSLNFLIPKLNLKKPDIIIGTTVHPFAPLIAYKFAKKYKIPFIFEIRDLWPQSFIDMKIWNKESLVSKVFKKIEAYTVKKSNHIIILSPKTKQYLLDEYRYDKTMLIPNSVDLEAVEESLSIKSKDNITIKTLSNIKKSGQFICLFTGAIVETNTIHIFVEMARVIRDKNIQIVLVGQGQEKVKYEQIKEKESLDNISFLHPVEKSLVPKLLKLSDCLLLIQGNIQWGSSNKLYDYLAAKKPIVTSLYAKHNDIVEEINCGYSSDYNNSNSTIEKILKVYNHSKTERDKMGKNAYEYVMANHDIKLMAKKLDVLCKDLIKRGVK